MEAQANKETFVSNKGYTHQRNGIWYKFVQKDNTPIWQLSDRTDELSNVIMFNAFTYSLDDAYNAWEAESRKGNFPKTQLETEQFIKERYDKETDTMSFRMVIMDLSDEPNEGTLPRSI